MRIAPLTEEIRVKIRTNLGGGGNERELNGGVVGQHVGEVPIPLPLRLAARIEGIDYFSPIWLNLIALSLWLKRYLLS